MELTGLSALKEAENGPENKGGGAVTEVFGECGIRVVYIPRSRGSIEPMALADLTKQIAQQALLSATTPSKEPPRVAADGPGHVMLGQVAAIQKQLKDDEELVVTFQQGMERIRVLEIVLASPAVAVLVGPDAHRALTRVVASVASLQLVCKTAKVPAGTKPIRVGLVTPKP